MESERVAALVRAIELRVPRRAALLVIAGGLATLLTRFGVDDADAKKKHKKKQKKKTCKSGTKKCGPKCIAEDDCCPSCTSLQICVNGACTCPPGTHCADCVTGSQCCDDAECGSGSYVCDEGSCVCTSPSDVPCTATCCGDEVCASGPDSEGVCQAGGCPTTDWCSDENLYLCGLGCSCVTSVGNTNVCTDWRGGACMACVTDEECTTAIGKPALCIPNGVFCDVVCEPVDYPTFCVVSGCPSGTPLPNSRAAAGGLMHKQMLLR